MQQRHQVASRDAVAVVVAQEGALVKAGYAVEVINPLVVAARRNITIRGTKTDSADALLIAHLLRETDLKVCAIPDRQVQSLRDLTRLRFFTQVYQRQIDRGKHHLVALTRVANKMLHVVFSVLKNNRPYTPQLNGDPIFTHDWC